MPITRLAILAANAETKRIKTVARINFSNREQFRMFCIEQTLGRNGAREGKKIVNCGISTSSRCAEVRSQRF